METAGLTIGGPFFSFFPQEMATTVTRMAVLDVFHSCGCGSGVWLREHRP